MNFKTYLYYSDIIKYLPDYAGKYLDPALEGDVKSAKSVISAAPNDLRGDIIMLLYKSNAPRDALKEALDLAWVLNSNFVIAAAQNRRTLCKVFRRAAFQIPDFPEKLRVYRGVANCKKQYAEKGFSWTLDRDTACWFALRNQSPNPLVLSAEIERESIVYFSNDRDEHEIVVFDVDNSEIDGDSSDWILGYNRKIASRR